MTRINLVPPRELMDQHLFAEFREIKMVPKSLRRSLDAARKRCRGHEIPLELVRKSIPAEYTLNTGHVSFFYDKASYLRRRYAELRAELVRRGVNFNKDSELDTDGNLCISSFNNDYTPTFAALQIIRTRIAEKIAMKPSWYRYEGKPL